MHPTKAPAVAILLGLATVFCQAAPAAAQAPRHDETAALVTRGARVYSQQCQRCHSPRAPTERTDREWVIIMQHMQLRANLSRDRAREALAFLLASNGEPTAAGGAHEPVTQAPAEAAVTDAMLSAGRAIYRGAGGCTGCHGARLDGGPIAPSLADARWTRGDGTLQDILQVIQSGVPGTAMVAHPGGISDEQAIQVAAYVWAVAHGKTSP